MRSPVLLCLSLCVALLHGEGHGEQPIFIWHDADGTVQFSDQAKAPASAEQNTRSGPPNIISPVSQTSFRFDKKLLEKRKAKTKRKKTRRKKTSACALAWKQYQLARTCYKGCAITGGKASNKVNNIAACGHCTDVARPHCEK